MRPSRTLAARARRGAAPTGRDELDGLIGQPAEGNGLRDQQENASGSRSGGVRRAERPRLRMAARPRGRIPTAKLSCWYDEPLPCCQPPPAIADAFVETVAPTPAALLGREWGLGELGASNAEAECTQCERQVELEIVGKFADWLGVGVAWSEARERDERERVREERAQAPWAGL